jgi:hypothetical protein
LVGYFSKFFFNILHGSAIGKRLVGEVEVIFYQPFSEPGIEFFRT